MPSGVLVEMYTGLYASVTKVGTVLFGHVDQPVANDIYHPYLFLRHRHVDQIGWTPTYCSGCECYTARHVHMAACGISG